MSLEVALHTIFKDTSNICQKPQKDKILHSKCPHYFGYLSERNEDTNIPEECLICSKAVKCIVVPSHSLNADLHVRAIKENENRSLAQFI